MITREQAELAASHLEALNQFAPNDAILAAIVGILEHKCLSPEHADRVIEAYLQNPLRDSRSIAQWPDPSTILALCWDTRTSSEKRSPFAHCPRCGGQGWRIAEVRKGVELFDRCECNPAADAPAEPVAAGQTAREQERARLREHML